MPRAKIYFKNNNKCSFTERKIRIH